MRTSVRFPLHLRVRVLTEAGQVDATTEDISATGVLFMMPFAPKINTRLSWTLSLPREVMGQDISVHCIGRVVWHGPEGNKRQVGAVIDEYHIGERSDH